MSASVSAALEQRSKLDDLEATLNDALAESGGPLTPMRGLVFDTGALIALVRGDRRVISFVERAVAARAAIAVPAGVVGQAWRDGARQVRLVRFLAHPVTEVIALDDAAALAAGQLCGLRRTRDVIDASVVLCAIEREQAVVTSDPHDLRHLAPTLNLIEV